MPHLRTSAAQVVCVASLAALALLLDSELPAHAADAVAGSVSLSLPDLARAAGAKAFRGGVAGFGAGIAQVFTFMWLRTCLNSQYASGGTLAETLRRLWAEGGLPRLYSGISIALVQTPLARMGDAATNVGVLALFASAAPSVPLPLQTAFASAAGAAWRLCLAPLDTLKTARQVAGAGAGAVIDEKLRLRGPTALWDGALAAAAATWIGSYPWFAAFNSLQAALPPAEGAMGVVRNASIGVCASCVSDTVSNGVRVVKTVRQSSAADVSYLAAAQAVLAVDGWRGLLGRGLGTRLLVNALQGAAFSVLLKLWAQ